MIIDIHNHILSGIDDGSKDYMMTLDMLKIAESEGISTIIATPHFISEYNSYDREKLLLAYNKTKEIIDEHKLKLDLYLGNELFIDSSSKKAILNGECLTLANSQYVLIELPNRWNNEIMEELFYEIEISGYKIVLAHIERYDYFVDHPEVLKEYILKGVYTQINASSVTSSDKRTQKYSKKLIENGYVYFIASDAHSNKRRSPRIREAYDIVHKWIGNDADKLFSSNAQKIIQNEPLVINEPLEIKKRFFF